MNDYPDTSFMCAVYRAQSNHLAAQAYRRNMAEPLPYTSLLEFEFLQATRLQVFLNSTDRTKGFTPQQAATIIDNWQFDCATGLYIRVPYDTEVVTQLALSYSERFTPQNGHRALDILHVATAIHLGAKTFLTFDARQKALAKFVGLKVPFK